MHIISSRLINKQAHKYAGTLLKGFLFSIGVNMLLCFIFYLIAMSLVSCIGCIVSDRLVNTE